MVLLAAGIVVAAAEPAMAWGAVTHVRLATELLGQIGLLPAAVAALLAKHAVHFLYGNVAADVVLGKRFSKVRHVCHRWQTAQAMLESAGSSESKAFAYGYLTHLAADLVAHNKFLPRQLLLTGTTVNFGHLLWEIRADACVDVTCWKRLHGTLIRPFPEHQALLERHLTETLLPFEFNLKLFNNMHLLVCARRWRRLVDRWGSLSRFALDVELLSAYHAESLGMMQLALTDPHAGVMTGQDPSGFQVLKRIRQTRRLLRRLSWRGLDSRWLAKQMASAYEPGPLQRPGQTRVA